MNNYKSVPFNTAASLAALLACTALAAPALAQSASGPSATGFTGRYGIAIVQDSTPRAAWPSATLSDGSDSVPAADSARLRDLQQLARSGNATWRKVY